jgi:hypothetical protein
MVAVKNKLGQNTGKSQGPEFYFAFGTSCLLTGRA